MALLILAFTSIVVTVVAEIPDGYILRVNPECGSDGIADATVHVITDLDATAAARCNNGEFSFTNLDRVNHKLTVSYTGGDPTVCQFHKRSNALVYVIQVTVAYGEPGSLVHQDEEEYTVTCTYDPKVRNETNNNNIIEGLIAPSEIQSHLGDRANSTVSLEMTDVLGRSLGGQDVPMGKMVYLESISSGSAGEFGLRAVSCNAVAINTNQKYAILRAGCGDGIIFEKDEGFTTDGLESRSPYFAVFTIEDEADIKFECNFTLCTKNCDGSSCTNERKKRASFGIVRDAAKSGVIPEIRGDSDLSAESPNHEKAIIEGDIASDSTETDDPDTTVSINSTTLISTCVGVGILVILAVTLAVVSCMVGRAKRVPPIQTVRTE